jgi:hypothetical protein
LDIPLAGPTLLKRVLHSFLRPPRRVLIHLDLIRRRAAKGRFANTKAALARRRYAMRKAGIVVAEPNSNESP